MRPLTTLALFLTSLVLGVVIWWTDRESTRLDSDRDTAGGGKALLRLTPEKIGRLIIKRPGGETILQQREGFWFLESPVTDRADPETMEALLDLLSHLTVLDQIPIDEIGSRPELAPEALGLTGDQVIRVELEPAPIEGGTTPGGDTRVVLIGNPAPLTNSLYARIPGSEDQPDVYVVDGNPRKYLDDPVRTLRDRHLFLAPPEEIEEITIKTPRGDIVMRREIAPRPTDWRLLQPLEARADLERIDGLLASLAALRVEHVISSDEPPGPAPNPVPDGEVVLEFRRHQVETPLTLHLRPAPGPADDSGAEPLIEALVSDRQAVFQIRSRLLATLPESPNAFRDPHLAVIPPLSVLGIAIESRGNPPVILKAARSGNGVRWFSERNGVEEPANTRQITELLEAINQEEVIDFAADSAPDLAAYNLASPAVKISISHYERQPDLAPDGAPAGGAGQPGIGRKTLQLGYREIGENGFGGHQLFANFVGEPHVYEINPGFSEKVPTHPLKWKDLRILSFTPISLREITRQRGGEELELIYDYRADDWEATLGGAEASDRVNPEVARKLRDTLGSLSANRWLTPSPQAFQALETPGATFTVTLETVDRATGGKKDVTHRLRFAKATEAIDESMDSYYGRLDDSPDIFQVDYSTLRDLTAPVLSIRVQPPR